MTLGLYGLILELMAQNEKVIEYDQKILQLHPADQSTTPWGRATEH